MPPLKHLVAYFCVPVNVFLMILGIVINNFMLSGTAFAACGLVLLPIYYEKYGIRLEKEESAEQEDKRPLP